MSKRPSKGGVPALDMTPMVDLAFLLVTFFMLTASFRMAEPVTVDPPSSIGQISLPDNHLMVTVDEKGRAFFGLSNVTAKTAALDKMSEKYNVTFTELQRKKFGGLSSFGVEVKDLPRYIDASEDERMKFQPQRGVPLDSTNNQLRDWISFGGAEAVRIFNEGKKNAEEKNQEFKAEKPRYAIKADGGAKYMAVKDIVKVFTDLKIYQFNLITTLEANPNER
jgi:biopolymer transport protein ExbD